MHGLSSGRAKRSEWNRTGAKRRGWAAGRTISELQLLVGEQELGSGVGRADFIQLSPRASQSGTWHEDDLPGSDERTGYIGRDRLPEAIRLRRQTGWSIIDAGSDRRVPVPNSRSPAFSFTASLLASKVS